MEIDSDIDVAADTELNETHIERLVNCLLDLKTNQNRSRARVQIIHAWGRTELTLLVRGFAKTDGGQRTKVAALYDSLLKLPSSPTRRTIKNSWASC